MLSHVGWLRRVGIVLVIIVCIQCLHAFSNFQAQKRLVLDHDRALASEIYQRIVAEIPDFDRRKTYPLEFYGAHEFRNAYKEVQGSTWSASFFEWDNGNSGRIVQFMAVLGYSNFERIDRATRASLLPAFGEMPIWPAAGSVRVVDGTVLVRLGERPGCGQTIEEPKTRRVRKPNACVSSPGTSIRSACGSNWCGAWCKQEQPDVLCLQEIKVYDSCFRWRREGPRLSAHPAPRHEGLNGVAILSSLPMLAEDPSNWCAKNDSRQAS